MIMFSLWNLFKDKLGIEQTAMLVRNMLDILHVNISSSQRTYNFLKIVRGKSQPYFREEK